MRTIRVLFLAATRSDPWQNKLVSHLDPPFCHTELEFDNGPIGTNVATSIFANETVFMRPRSYANPNYTIITLHVTDRQFDKMNLFAARTTQRKVGFDGCAMYLAYCKCIPSFVNSDKTFCSSYVTSILQSGEIPEVFGIDPHKTTPSQLYNLLHTSRRQCFSSVPYKIDLITVPQMHVPRQVVMH